LSYASASSSVLVDLALGSATNGTFIQSITGFEQLTGSGFADILLGSSGANLIDGGAGNDTLIGGAGIDALSYGLSTGAVKANLATGVTTGAAGSDAVSGFEELLGSSFNDRLTGSTGDNTLFGDAGTDSLYGCDGNDILDGGTGNNSMAGGAGDAFYVVDGTDSVSELANKGTDTVQTAGAYVLTADGRCCKTPCGEDSHFESMRLDGAHDQAFTRPLPHDELAGLQCGAVQSRLVVDPLPGNACLHA
jgi:Ca2+-binding RTX toxin-like protein